MDETDKSDFIGKLKLKKEALKQFKDKPDYTDQIKKIDDAINSLKSESSVEQEGGYTTSNWVGILSGLAVIAACAFRP